MRRMTVFAKMFLKFYCVGHGHFDKNIERVVLKYLRTCQYSGLIHTVKGEFYSSKHGHGTFCIEIVQLNDSAGSYKGHSQSKGSSFFPSLR